MPPIVIECAIAGPVARHRDNRAVPTTPGEARGALRVGAGDVGA